MVSFLSPRILYSLHLVHPNLCRLYSPVTTSTPFVLLLSRFMEKDRLIDIPRHLILKAASIHKHVP